MADSRDFSEQAAQANSPADTPFHEEIARELHAGSDGSNGKWRFLSPDKAVIDAKDLNSINSKDLLLLRGALEQSLDQCSKVAGSLRQVMNQAHLDGSEGAKKRADAYSEKVLGVLRENLEDANKDVPLRVALPVQSFSTEANGQLKAETLYALFPPKEANISDRYITFPLHSADPTREAQLRKEGSMAASCSYEEFNFCCKRDYGSGNSLLPRKDRAYVDA